MGLTIHYRYRGKVGVEAARCVVEQLWEFAKGMGFDLVGPVVEYGAAKGERSFEEADEEDLRLMPRGIWQERKRADGLTELVEVRAVRAMGFVTYVRGAEMAWFGLAAHPRVVVHREEVVTVEKDGIEERRIGAGAAVEWETKLEGWYSWQSFCKTQYAGNPELGGVANFLKAHKGVIAMLDQCRELGLEVNVKDEGNYWVDRDEKRLVAEVAKWDELMAALAGTINDAIGRDQVVAPIRERGDFEHLEAKGVERMRKRGEKR